MCDVPEGSLSGSKLLHAAIRRAAQNTQSTGKKISYEKLWPYVEKALPFLVSHALARTTTTYASLSKIIGAGNPQNGNRPFGAILIAFDDLLKDRDYRGPSSIPNLPSIVTRTNSSKSGTGVLLSDPANVSRSPQQQEEWLEKERNKVFLFGHHWLDVLAGLGLCGVRDLDVPQNPLSSAGAVPRGESSLHKRLKQFIAEHPNAVMPSSTIRYAADLEWLFLSADRVDIMLTSKDDWIAIEVKTSECLESELYRGIFQAVKYEALLSATLLIKGDTARRRCILALGGELPPTLCDVADRLGVKRIENLELLLAREDQE